MYKYDYRVEIEGTEKDSFTTCVLKVKFDIHQEVAPVTLKDVRKRTLCSLVKEGFMGDLGEYLTSVEGLKQSSGCVYKFGDDLRQVEVYHGFNGAISQQEKLFTFFYRGAPKVVNIHVFGSKILPSDQMLDMNALNHFLITGEMKALKK